MKKCIALILVVIMVVMAVFPSVAYEWHKEEYAEVGDFTGKKISILGDSISTYANYSNSSAALTTNSTIGKGAVYYPRSGFDVAVEDTWWKKTADRLGMEILVNNSWSGSCLLNTRSGTVGAYLDRCVQLHDDTGDNAGEHPDIIAIFLGTNDFYTYPDSLGRFYDINFNNLIIEKENSVSYATPKTSIEAYAIILDKISRAYPDAEVYCFTLLQRIDAHTSAQPLEFNSDIASLAKMYGAQVVDLYNCGILTDSIAFKMFMGDTLHPNRAGMEAISNAFTSTLLKNSKYLEYSQVHDVRFELDGVVAMEGALRAAVEAHPFKTEIVAIDPSMHFEVNVFMGDRDITAECYENGVIIIQSVRDDVFIKAYIAKEIPESFYWRTEENSIVSVTDDFYEENALTLKSGAILNGNFRNVRIEMEKTVLLKHDKPWYIEWKSEGAWYDNTDGALLFSESNQSVNSNCYLYRRYQSEFIAFGMAVGGKYYNYGVSLKQNGINGIDEHTYRIENRVFDDGYNMPFLLVDGKEIGAMNHHWIGGTDQKKAVDWLNGRDLVFKYMGTSPHTIGDCRIEYIKVSEDGAEKEVTEEKDNFYWRTKENPILSISDGFYKKNNLTLTSGDIVNGKFSNVKITMDEAIALKHDKPWYIEWESEGYWSDTTDGALLFAGSPNSTTPDTPYLYRRHNSDFIAFGVASGGRYYNYGVSLSQNGINGIKKHIYRIENRVLNDGHNMAYLLVDGKEIGAMNHHWIGGTDQKITVDWLDGRDLVFKYMGTSPHTIGNCYIDYIKVSEDGAEKEITDEKDNFYWQTKENSIVSVSDDFYKKNELTLMSGAIKNGKFSNVKITMDEPIVLKHDKPWYIEWKSEGSWSDTTDGALLFAGSSYSTTERTMYLYRRHNSDFIAFGEVSGGRYNNYGVSLSQNGIDGTKEHTYRIENRLFDNGRNMPYLFVDGKEIGAMNHYWIGGTDQNMIANRLVGADLVFQYMGTSPHTIGNCYIEYIKVSEGGHTHVYENGACVECGDILEIPEEQKTFEFYIGDCMFTAVEGQSFAEWISSYGISAGDNGIVWIGYQNHPLMQRGYLYYGADGIALGEAQIMLGDKPIRYDDKILKAKYTIGGPNSPQ